MAGSQQETDPSAAVQIAQDNKHNTVVCRALELSDLQRQIAHARRPKTTASVREEQV